MVDKEIGIVIKAIDQATGTIKKIGNDLSGRAEKNTKTFQTMAVAGTAVFSAITAGAMKSVSAFAESERAERQLNHAIVDVSKGTLAQVEAIKKQTQALQNKAGVDADSLNVGVAQLATFGLQTKSVQDLTKSLADLTVNQHGVNASADQYEASANLMQKALQGQFGKLEMMGIRFTKAQQDMINYGTEAEKVATIQEGFAQNLKETTDTLGGADLSMARARRTMEDMVETVGSALAPALNQIVDAIQPVIEHVSKWVAENPELTKNIILVTGAIAGLVAIVGVLGMALPSIITGFTLLTGPIGLAIAGIGALTYAFVNNVGGIRDTVLPILEQIKFGFQVFFEAIKIFREDRGAEITIVVTAIFETIKGIIEGVFYIISGIVKVFFEGFSFWMNVFQGNWAGAWENVKNIGITIMKTINSTMTAIWGDLWTNIVGGMASAYDRIVGKFDALVSVVTSAVSKLKSLWDSATSFGSSSSSKTSGKRAFGGTVQAGKSYLVGERGPEMFTPATTGSINTNAGSSNVSIAINMGGVVVQNDADENRLIDKLKNSIAREMQLYKLGIN